MASNRKLDEVVEAELSEIKQRRDKAHVPQGDVKDSLVGLCLSGGAIRSSTFSLGFVQALQKIGLWKYVDYLSTVSGGGYIGSYLTSAILKDKEPVSKTNQPFSSDATTAQNAQVKRFIYGGHYLLKPWRLANMYLMGLFFINLAIFSGLLAFCSAVAYVWRCFDFDYARAWAKMLGAGSDLQAPFWPFFVFALAWLIAWCVSLFQRGGEATGRVARHLLLAMLFSLLVGLALLFGNGDIAGWNGYAAGSNVSLDSKAWGPIVALILGGLLPFLSPQRLLQSGLNPKQDWERYVFKMATTALLVGMPMILIGTLAQENISGFNTDEYRPVVAGDIQDWASLTGMMADQHLAKLVASPFGADSKKQIEELQEKQLLGVRDVKAKVSPSGRLSLWQHVSNLIASLFSNDIETAIERPEPSPPSPTVAVVDPAVMSSQERAFQLAIVGATKQMRSGDVEEVKSKIAALTDSEAEVDLAIADSAVGKTGSNEVSAVEASDPRNEKKDLGRGESSSKDVAISVKGLEKALDDQITQKSPLTISSWSEVPASLLSGLAITESQRDPNQKRAVSEFTAAYLTFAAKELQQRQIEFARADAAFLKTGQWQRFSVVRYLERLFDIASWKFRDSGHAKTYWEAERKLKEQEQQFALAFDEVMRQPAFTKAYLANTDIAAILAQETDPKTLQLTAFGKLLTRAVLTDENMVAERNGESAANVDEWMPYERHQLARLLLEHDFPSVFRARSEIRRAVSIVEDQATRAEWFFWSLLVFVIAGMWVDVNSLSLHRYYRNRIAQAFIVPRNVKAPSVPLSDLVTTEYGGPYHLINASVGVIRRGVGEEEAFFRRDGDDADSDQRWVDSFLFSRLYCGSEITGYADTVAYEHSIQGYTHKIDLAEATAISGAALSPGHVQNWLLAFLMVALNLSLGQWVPNPHIGRPRSRPRVLTLLWSLWKRSTDRPYCFVSDGGHHENLGLVQLFKRRCKLIIAVDASCDPEHDFHDLGRAMRMARVHGGVRLLELEPDKDGNDVDLSLKPILHGSGDDAHSTNTAKHFVMGRIRYCDGNEGLLIYVKPSLTGDESADLLQYREQSAQFPQEPTTDQMFDPAQVEAYRHLGYHIGMELQKLLPSELTLGELWEYPDVDTKLLCDWLTGEGDEIERTEADRIIKHPLTASQEAKVAARPIANQILKKMRQKFRSPADIEGNAFREMLEHDRDFVSIRPSTAVAALQCAIIDRQQRKAEEREFSVWLLRSIEEDDALPTNTMETLEILAEAARPVHPEKVRTAAIAVLCILGRGPDHREFVKQSLAELSADPKATIRLAVRNALSNLDDSPNRPR